MRPYLAIIKDSFREALHSYVLWALIVVLSSILLLLAPFSYSEQLVGNLPWGDVAEWRLLLISIKEGSQSEGPSPSKHIYGMLDEELQRKIDRLWEDLQADEEVENEANLGLRIVEVCTELHAELNRLLEEEDLYDARAWADVELTDEAQELVAKDSDELSQARLRRRNRLLLEAAYPVLVRKSIGVEYRPTYMGRTIAQIPVIGAPSATTKEAVVEWYKGYIGWLMNWVVTLIIVFVGIIFTSAIIPRMLEPGSITLLLSKPVRRSYLFLAKFLGGCAFMLLSAGYVVLGIFLLAGVRLGIWDPKVFMCIPLFTFVFAVYFSVSAYVGAIWRSAIVSVLVVIAFYWTCFFVGFAKVNLADSFLDAARMVDVVQAGPATLVVDEMENTYFWDQDAREWKQTFQRPMAFSMDRSKKPLLYDEENNRLLSTAVSFTPGTFGSGGMVLAVGRDEDAWAMKEGVALPPGTMDLFLETDGHLLAVSPLGFFRLVGDALPEEESGEDDATPAVEARDDANGEAARSNAAPANDDSETAPDSETATDGDAAVPANEPTREEFLEPESLSAPFQPVGPDKPLDVAGPMAVEMNHERKMIAVYTGGVVAVYEQNGEGNYVRLEKKEIPGGEQKAATLGFAGGTLIIGRDDGKVFVLEATTLRQIEEYTPEGEVPPRFIESAPGGKWFALLFQNRKLWLYDATEKKMQKADLWSQGDVSAVGFSGPDALLVVDRVARLRELELPSLAVARTLDPVELPQFESGELLGVKVSFMTFYRWVLTPLYTILPRPGELGWTMRYVMTGEKTATWDTEEQPGIGRSADISSHKHAQRDPWAPVISCGVFVAVMLALGCWYIERREF